MKLRLSVLPLLVFLAFGYGVHTLDRVSDNNDLVTADNFKAQVKADLSNFTPSTKFTINE